jgi:hypothetical protein
MNVHKSLAIRKFLIILFHFTKRKKIGAKNSLFIQSGLELAILLPQPPECWDYRCAPSHLAQEMIFFSFIVVLLIMY